MKRTFFLLLALCFAADVSTVHAQTGPDTYVWPKDPEVSKNLKKWQGYKFGLLIHMGLYSELGTVESWGLCPEEWVGREVDNYFEYCTGVRGDNWRAQAHGFQDRQAKTLE